MGRADFAKLILIFTTAVFAAPVSAGFIELGGSANYRSSSYTKDNYIMSLSYTASISYYFLETSAWEVNYTTGYSKQSTQALSEEITTIEDNIELVSTDLVFSFAGRQDPFRPYVKGGVGYLTKERFRKIGADNKEKISTQRGVVPSAGVGFAISITKEFNIKLGIDAWTSPLNDKDAEKTTDYAGRAGVSWIF